MIKTATNKSESLVADTTQATTSEFRVGPDPRGPAKCFKCRRPFKQGESWTRMTSPTDPKHGAYSIGIHSACERQKQ